MNLPAPKRASPAQIENAMKLFGHYAIREPEKLQDNNGTTINKITIEADGNRMSEEEISLESILRDKPKAKIVREFIKENLPCDSDSSAADE